MSRHHSQNEAVADPLERACQRERSERPLPGLAMEHESVFAHVFRCECCDRTRRDEGRREPDSSVCIQCVREAGFES